MSPGDAEDRAPPTDPNDPHPDGRVSGHHPFPVVGIGASAGGLEAFSDLLTHLPPDPGLAILFVLHLEPNHKSQLADVLAHKTALPVRQAADGTHVERDHVYVIPPDANLALVD